MHYLQAGQILRGFEQFFIDLMSDRDLAHAFLGRLHRVYLGGPIRSSGRFGDSIDAVFLTDDLGTQQSGVDLARALPGNDVSLHQRVGGPHQSRGRRK